MLGDLSRRKMVSNGHVTGLIERLVVSGQRARAHATDRRATQVRLTVAGPHKFARMACAHEGWVAEAFQALSRRRSRR